MIIKTLGLQNFRSWRAGHFRFSPQKTLLVGPNASGKTNLLEAIWVLAWQKSFRAKSWLQLIHWQADGAQIQAEVIAKTGPQRLGVSLWQKEGKLVKSYLVNGAPVKRRQFHHLAAVIFRPEDIRFVRGSPARRRRLFDRILAGTDWQYHRALARYQRALRQRNQLLLNNAPAGQFLFWEKELAIQAAILQKQRYRLVTFINHYWQTKAPTWLPKLRLRYQASVINLAQLQAQRLHDRQQGHTRFGPQRDDFALFDQEGDLALWASRGQQRLAVLGLKLALAAYLAEVNGEWPLILLDDIFSELDEDHQEYLRQFPWPGQTIWTATTAISDSWEKVVEIGARLEELGTRKKQKP